METTLLSQLSELGQSAVVLTIIGLITAAMIIAAVFACGWWITNRVGSRSPYTKGAMAKGSQLPFSSVQCVVDFLDQLDPQANPHIDLTQAAVCRDTGRIFPKAINKCDVIKVKWNFLNKRKPGTYIPWGGLTDAEKRVIVAKHSSLKGFQTQVVDSAQSPRKVSPAAALAKPGPLYVDLDQRTLVGWKCIPNSELEVLVVQKPDR